MINGDCLVGLCAIKVALHSIEFVVCTTVVNVFVGNQSATHTHKRKESHHPQNAEMRTESVTKGRPGRVQHPPGMSPSYSQLCGPKVI